MTNTKPGFKSGKEAIEAAKTIANSAIEANEALSSLAKRVTLSADDLAKLEAENRKDLICALLEIRDIQIAVIPRGTKKVAKK